MDARVTEPSIDAGSAAPTDAAKPATSVDAGTLRVPLDAGAPARTPPDARTASKASTAGIGEECGANDACAAGLVCVTYYGIAGPRGPEFKSCEVRCGGKTKSCPSGTSCVTIADGPGQVCRP